MIFKKLASIALVAAVFAALATTSARPAHAAVGSTPACSLTTLQYDAGRIYFTCASGTFNQFYIFLSAPGCTTADPDSFKVFNTMLQSAVLSGKPIDVVFQPATATCSVATAIALALHN